MHISFAWIVIKFATLKYIHDCSKGQNMNLVGNNTYIFFQDIPKQYNAYDCGMFVCMVSFDHYFDCIGMTQKLIEGHNEIKLLFTLLVCWILEQRGSPHI